jgi:hypothetical protein
MAMQTQVTTHTYKYNFMTETFNQDTLNNKKHIGIIFGPDIHKSAIPPLKFLILYLNCLQNSFEYQFLPNYTHDFLKTITDEVPKNHHDVRRLIPDFLRDYESFCKASRMDYGLQDTEGLPEYYILITLARFSDNYYLTGLGKMGIIALGNWERFMAPPSLLEFLLTLVLVESVYLLHLTGFSHLGTKGCLFDFNPQLDNVRYATLQAFVCNNCRNALTSSGYGSLVDELVKVLDKTWLGQSTNPSSPAGIVFNLGYDLFFTKGLKATIWEKTITTLRDEGVKAFLSLLGGLILTGFLVYLGLKKP